MESIIIAATRKWNIEKAKNLCKTYSDYKISIITEKEELILDSVKIIKPKYIFFPHWSWIVPRDIYENFTCVLFHMTDLPFGRGGSPLQNLISRGMTETKISAVKMCKEIDAGDVYLKTPLSLFGGAEEIYMRAAEIIFNDMIPYIIKNNPVAIPQCGEPVCFARRTPEMSEFFSDMKIDQIFNHIRMLDAEGYPKAYIKCGNYKLCFSRPKRTASGLVADVEMEVISD